MDDSREKDRDRSRRGDRPSRFSDANRDRSNDRGTSDCKRLFVSNIPYEYRWTELKDLFKEKVGEVSYVELFNDDNGKPKGCGVVEFANADAMRRALSVMHRHELNGRKLVLKEETGNERGRGNNPPRSGGGAGGPGGGNRHNNMSRDDKDNWQNNMNMNMNMNNSREPENFTTYGLSLQFLESINVQPPLVKKVFVANLDYKVDRAKIKEIFKIAGKVRNIDLAVDKDGNSRGFAVVEYDHPVEAVQAISMFDKQTLFERRMTVRMDRSMTDKSEFRLPEGLKGMGLGLGPNGEPLRDVANNLPQNQNQNNNMVNNPTMGANVLNAVPNAGLNLNGIGAGLAANTLNTTAGIGANLGLQQALGLTSLGALQNQLLQQGLTANDLASVLTQANLNTGLLNTGTDMTMLTNPLASSMLGNNANLTSTLNTANLANAGIGSTLSANALTTHIGGPGNSTSNNMRSMSSSQNYSNLSSMDYKDSKTMYTRETTSQQSSRDSKQSDMVVITNLPPTVTWQLIMEKFSECGEVKYAEMTAKDTAIVRFLKEWDADRAIKMFDRTRIDGRTIDVRYF